MLLFSYKKTQESFGDEVNRREKLEYMIKELVEINQLETKIVNEYSDKDLLFKTLRTISRPHILSKEYIKYEKEYLEEIKENKGIKQVESIIKDKNTIELLPNIYLYKGDITRVETDAIVNAANEKLLGCFVPGHACIDNAIHMAAGLELRNTCHELMVAQGRDELVGKAKITKGYHLPCKYVIHTVGPNVHIMPSASWDDVRRELASSYTSILEEANKNEDIKSIAFCSISTGLFGVPITIGSEVAIKTIQSYLETHEHHFEEIIIDVFSEEDYNEYCNTARKINKER